MKSKEERYYSLIQDRKKCTRCLHNPDMTLQNLSASDFPWLNKKKRYDSKYLNPWSGWQGNLSSNLLIVGNDWNSIKNVQEHKDDYDCNQEYDSDEKLCYLDPVNKQIIRYVNKYIGIKMERQCSKATTNEIFLTEAFLCLKDKNKKTNKDWEKQVTWECFRNCSPLLRKTIDLLFPKDVNKKCAVVTFGKPSTFSVLYVYWDELSEKLKTELENFGIEKKEDLEGTSFLKDFKVEEFNELIDVSNKNYGFALHKNINTMKFENVKLFPVDHPAWDIFNRGKYRNVTHDRDWGEKQVEKDWRTIRKYLNSTSHNSEYTNNSSLVLTEIVNLKSLTLEKVIEVIKQNKIRYRWTNKDKDIFLIDFGWYFKQRKGYVAFRKKDSKGKYFTIGLKTREDFDDVLSEIL